MGWFWQSTATSPNSTSASATTPSVTDSHSPPPAQAVSPRQAEDDAAEDELVKFLRMIQSDTAQSKASSTPTSAKAPSASSSKTTLPQSTHPNRPSPASAAINEAILPTTMSCRDAFDYAWHCHTPAAQWNAVYRYGGVRSCSDLWDDFWFCMRTKSFSPEMRAEATKAHFRVRENEKYYASGRPSSEDVWESREEKVEPGTAFRAGFANPSDNDTEWNLKEMERRRKIRQQTFGKDR